MFVARRLWVLSAKPELRPDAAAVLAELAGDSGLSSQQVQDIVGQSPVRTSPMQAPRTPSRPGLHAAILLPPALLCGRSSDPAVWLFLLLASAFYPGRRDGRVTTAPPAESLARGGWAAGALALTTGLTLLALFWVALGGCGRARRDRRRVAMGRRAAIVAGALLRRAAIGRLGPSS